MYNSVLTKVLLSQDQLAEGYHIQEDEDFVSFNLRGQLIMAWSIRGADIKQVKADIARYFGGNGK